MLYCPSLHVWLQNTYFLPLPSWWILTVQRTLSLIPTRWVVNSIYDWHAQWKVFSVKGSRYQRCDFEKGLCDLIQSSDSALSGWFRTAEVPGLKHGHTNSTSGLIWKSDLIFWCFHFWIHSLHTSLYFAYIQLFTLFLFPIAHFLSLLPVGGNRTTADLMSPVFLPSQTCQVTKPFSLSIMRITDKNLILIPHLFPPQLSFYHYVGAKHGHLQVFVHQSDTQGQITEVWKNSTPSLMETWSRTVIAFSSNHSFQVCKIHCS